MSNLYKKSNLFFLIAPAAAGIWAILASTIFINSANKEWDKREDDFKKSQPIIAEILALEPERINKLSKQKEKAGKFDYNTVIEKFADAHGIPETGYSLRASAQSKRGGKLSQSATLTIDNIRIEPFSRFLSEMLYVWPDLQCEKLTLTKQNSGPDAWKALMQYKYNFKK